jgi:Cu-Zn family superoxide dismutase
VNAPKLFRFRIVHGERQARRAEMTRTLVGAALAMALAACATTKPVAAPEEQADAQASAAADIRDASGRIRARATVAQSGVDLRLRIAATGMAPGAYGAHVHAVGRCDPPGFAAAGPHWNPAGRQHGKDNPAGMHKGDLPNLLVGADGSGSFEIELPHATISGRGADVLLDADGAAVVIHAMPDDFRTDPSGNSGARIACGVLG